MTYNNCTGIIAAYMVSYGCTVDQHVYVHFLLKILRPKIQQTCSQMYGCVIILCDNACPHIATLVTVFQEYRWEVLNNQPAVLNWVSPPPLQPIPKTQWIIPVDSFQWLKWIVTWEIWQLNKNQLFTWNRKAARMLTSLRFARWGLHWRVIM